MATCRYLHVNNMVHQNTKQTSCHTVWPAAIRPTWTTWPESKCREIGRYSTRAECEAGIRCSPNTNAGLVNGRPNHTPATHTMPYCLACGRSKNVGKLAGVRPEPNAKPVFGAALIPMLDWSVVDQITLQQPTPSSHNRITIFFPSAKGSCLISKHI